MFFARFLSIIQYSNDCPQDIHPARWNAMKLWFEKRKSNKDWIDREKIILPENYL